MVDWGVSERQQMLQRLNTSHAPPTYRYLRQLVEQWLISIPFHNIDLLNEESPVEHHKAAANCLNGRGGGCHVHAAGFCALIQSLGFSASLASATIGAPEDHLLVTVVIGHERYWVDVGNGQPYIQPFPSSKATLLTHLGWTIRTTPVESGILLERTSADQPQWRTVYTTTNINKRWRDFSDAIERHHTESGFGPFLNGLRVVDIGPTRIRTLRDDVLTEYNGRAFHKTRLQSEDAIAEMAAQLVSGPKRARNAVRRWFQRSQSVPS